MSKKPEISRPACGGAGGPPPDRAYRLDPSVINRATCLGRVMGPDGGDTRWKPVMYVEYQCGEKVFDHYDLCADCQRREATWRDTDIQVALKNGWCGRVTEPVSDYQHTTQTKWAAGLLGGRFKKPVWLGEGAPVLEVEEVEEPAAATPATHVLETRLAALEASHDDLEAENAALEADNAALKAAAAKQHAYLAAREASARRLEARIATLEAENDMLHARLAAREASAEIARSAALRAAAALAPKPKTRVLNLPTGTTIYLKRYGVVHKAIWNNEEQELTGEDGKIYTSISGWAAAIFNNPTNGWAVCYVRNAAGEKVPLSALRLTEPKTRD
jgi:hypothetical protein